MDTIDLFILAARAGLLVLPLSVGFLALRRLSLSRSGNAWIYAGAGLLSLFTLIGLLPWAIFALDPQPFAIGLALTLPGIWLIVILICGSGQGDAYDNDVDDADKSTADNADVIPQPAPLLLTSDFRAPDPVAVFKHAPNQVATRGHAPGATGSVLAAARAMRGNLSSEARRPKALPPPPLKLPFLRS